MYSFTTDDPCQNALSVIARLFIGVGKLISGFARKILWGQGQERRVKNVHITKTHNQPKLLTSVCVFLLLAA